MDAARFAARYPLLYHMAHSESWPSIARQGLLSTSSLLDRFGYQGGERDLIEFQWRSDPVPIEHPDYGRAVIRDQGPLRPDLLARCLTDGMTPSQWYLLLNRHVFFWVDEKHLDTLLNARAYRNQAHTVLTLDTARLLKSHLPTVRLSSINSGSVLRGGALRGPLTLLPMARFLKRDVVELCVEGSVPDVADLTLLVERRLPDGSRVPIYRAS